MATSRSRRIRLSAALTIIGLAATALAGCSSSGAGPTAGSGGARKVSIVAYSVPKPAYDALETAFRATEQGKTVSFDASYGASGDQSRAVSNGQHADYVAFSLEPDLTKLVPDFVDKTWNSGPTRGLVSDSVVVLAVRKGNPKRITGWDDLVKPGVKIVTPDPGSSGSAKWNLLAAWAHGLANGGDQATATGYLERFARNITSKPESGAKATQTFANGTGDVLISYENEAIGARQKGQSLDYVVPADTLLIENPAAVTRDGSQAAKDFLAFVEGETGQKTFASKGFRPVLGKVQPGEVTGANDPANPYPPVRRLTTISDLGGWSVVNKKYFDKADGIVTKILKGSG